MATNKSTLDIRNITLDDKYTILDIYRQCEDFLALGPEPKASLNMVLKDIEAARHEGGVFRGIYHNGKMVGVTSYINRGFEGKRQLAFISLLMIAAPYRGHGMGKEIIRRIEKEILLDSKVTAVLSAVQVNNPDALRFWEKNGYQITGGPELRPDKTTVVNLRKELKPVN